MKNLGLCFILSYSLLALPTLAGELKLLGNDAKLRGACVVIPPPGQAKTFEYDFTKDRRFTNDDAYTLVVQGFPAGTVIEVFDTSPPRTSKGYCRIQLNVDINRGLTIKNFERHRGTVRYRLDFNGQRPLNGKVSYVKVHHPAATTLVGKIQALMADHFRGWRDKSGRAHEWSNNHHNYRLYRPEIEYYENLNLLVVAAKMDHIRGSAKDDYVSLMFSVDPKTLNVHFNTPLIDYGKTVIGQEIGGFAMATTFTAVTLYSGNSLTKVTGELTKSSQKAFEFIHNLLAATGSYSLSQAESWKKMRAERERKWREAANRAPSGRGHVVHMAKDIQDRLAALITACLYTTQPQTPPCPRDAIYKKPLTYLNGNWRGFSNETIKISQKGSCVFIEEPSPTGTWQTELSGVTIYKGALRGMAIAHDYKRIDWYNQANQLQGSWHKMTPPQPPASPALQAAFTGKENYQAGGQTFTRYKFSVSNFHTLAAELFAPAPNLPPCGLNKNASRSWVYLKDGSNGQVIYSFCALQKTSDLTSLWFARTLGQAPPPTVMVTVHDRLKNVELKSQAVRVQ